MKNFCLEKWTNYFLNHFASVDQYTVPTIVHGCKGRTAGNGYTPLLEKKNRKSHYSTF